MEDKIKKLEKIEGAIIWKRGACLGESGGVGRR